MTAISQDRRSAPDPARVPVAPEGAVVRELAGRDNLELLEIFLLA